MSWDDKALENLLDLDGFRCVIDEYLGLWVKFDVKKVVPSVHRPHGIKYSLTLHDRLNTRIIGFDNAHLIAEENQRTASYDHWHRKGYAKCYPYKYVSPGKLITDFWLAVEGYIRSLEELHES